MKNPLLCLTLLLGSAGAATAQTTALPADSLRPASQPGPRYAVGVKAGAGYTSFQGDQATTFDNRYKLGFLAGLTADLRLTQEVTLHPEVLYVQKGSKFADATRNRDLAYLEVPVLLRYHTSGALGPNSVYLEAGPQLSVLLTAKNEARDDVKSDFKPLGVGFALGAGYRLANGLSLGFRYDLSFTDAYKPLPASATQGRGEFQPDLKNDMFAFSVGYSFSR